MAKVKENIQKVYDKCTALYDIGGVTAVCDHVITQQKDGNPMYDDVTYKYCEPCEAVQPNLYGVCLVCGSDTKRKPTNVQVEYTNGMVDSKGHEIRLGNVLHNIGQLRYLMADLDDHDLICIETCDEEGDVEDLYPMTLDVIDNIELNDGTNVREVRFCQRPQEPTQTEDYRIGLNFSKVYNVLLKTNKKTHIAKGMGYTTTTQLDNVLNGSSCISTPAIMNLVKVYNVNPTFLYTGLGNLFS